MGTTPLEFVIEKVNDKLVTFDNPPAMGKLRAHLDEEGRMVTLEGNISGNMQYRAFRIPLSQADSLMGIWSSSPPSNKIPHSPFAQIESKVGQATIKVEYSQPSKRGRDIFGGIIRMDEVWRTGANAATQIEISHDLSVSALDIPAGKYSLYSIPSPSQWILVINTRTGQWGTNNGYDESLDLARIPMQSKTLPEAVEQFTISVEEKDGIGYLKLIWDTTEAWVAFEVK